MSKDSVDSSDDEEEGIVNKIKSGYFTYIVTKLINIKDCLEQQVEEPVISFDYRLGIAMQHLADRFFRHTEIGVEYKKLKSSLLGIDKNTYDTFLQQVQSFFKMQKDLVQINDSIGNNHIIQLFNHLFSDKVLVPSTASITTANSHYKDQILTKMSEHLELTQIIQQIFPGDFPSLRQSSNAKNAAEVLAFSKIVNRYIKNELKAILSNSTDSLEVDKFIQFKFQKQTIRDLNESWIIRPQSKKAQNKIDSLGNYDEIFQDLNQGNKTHVINRVFSILCNKDITSIGIKNDQYSDKLVQLLFISELARNKSAVFTTLMFLSLLETQDISNNKEKLIKLFPMALKGAMQSSRDLINEDKLENTHYMDFNHEGMAHINILRAQGELWCAYDRNLEDLRKLIFLLDKSSRERLNSKIFLEHITTLSEIFPIQQALVEEAKNLQKIYLEIPSTLDEKKSYLKQHFSASRNRIEGSTGRTIQKVIDEIFYNKKNDLSVKYDKAFAVSNFLSIIEQILEQSINKLYLYAINKYGFEGFPTELQLKASAGPPSPPDKPDLGKIKILSGNDHTQLSGHAEALVKEPKQTSIDSKKPAKIIDKLDKAIPNPGGGDCAVYAVRDALGTINHELGKISNSDIQNLRQKICNVTKKFIPLYRLGIELERKSGESDADLQQRISDTDWQEVTNCYKNIFGQDNFDIFKNIVIRHIQDKLNAKGINEESVGNFTESKDSIIRASTWDYLNPQIIKQIFLHHNTLDVDVRAILQDHKLDYNATGDNYYNYASKPSIWLNNNEISAYLLTLGFIFESRVANPLTEGTYITYINSENQKLYFYNNGQDTTAACRGTGTHWTAARPLLETNTLSTETVKSSFPQDDTLETKDGDDNKILPLIKSKLQSECSDNIINSSYYIGNCYFYLGKNKDACSIYKALSDININNNNKAEIYYFHAMALENLNQKGEAIEKYNQSIKLNNQWWDVYHDKGILLFTIMDFDKALKCFDRAIELEPNSLFSYCYKLTAIEKTMSKIQKDTDLKPTEIQELFNQIKEKFKVKLDDGNYNKEGLMLYHQDDYKKGLEYFGDIIKEISSEEAYTNLVSDIKINNSFQELYRGAKYDKVIQESNNVAKNNNLDTYKLGIALYDLGDYTKSLGYFSKVIELSGSNVKEEYLDSE